MNSLISLDIAWLMSWLVALTFKGSFIIALVLLLQCLGRPWLSAQARYWLWMPALFCMFVPFGFEAKWSPFVRPAEIAASKASVETSVAADSSLFVGMNYSIVWVLCAVALFLVVLRYLICYVRILAGGRDIENSALELLEECRHRLNVRRPVRVLETHSVNTPTVFGVLKPSIILPEGLVDELGSDELSYVFLHELAHVKRHDILLNWLVTMVQIVHWFNPLVWYGFHRMRRDREIACDAHVLRHLRPDQHRAYGYTLISLMERNPQAIQFSPGLGIVGNTKQMKERLHMIKQFSAVRKGSVLAATIALLMVSVIAFSEHRSEDRGSFTPAQHMAKAEEGDAETVETVQVDVEIVRVLPDREMETVKTQQFDVEIHQQGGEISLNAEEIELGILVYSEEGAKDAELVLNEDDVKLSIFIVSPEK